MNKPLRRVSVFCLVLVAALMLRSNWIQVVKADDYTNHSKNRRTVYEAYAHPRGDFYVDGKAITGSRKTDDKKYVYERTYVNGPMYAPVIGYVSPYYGSNLLENINDDILSGEDSRLFVRRVLDTITNKGTRGGNVALTLNAKAQEAAYNGLNGKTGAAVALDPATGKVLAMVSTPSYDPAVLATNDDKAAQNAWDAMTQDLNDPTDEFDVNKPMDNRAIRYTYAPGSTFKLITTAAALSEGKYKPETPTNFESPMFYPQSVKELGDHGNEQLCRGATVQKALELSCNTVFAGMAREMGAEKLKAQADKFGFNNFGKGSEQKNALYIPSRVETSVIPSGIDEAQLMRSAIGQDSVAATPMQMAMVAAGIQNNGKVMQPYLVDELRAQNLSVIEKTQAKELSQAVSPEVSQQLRDMMVGVVTNGSGKRAKIDGATVGAKTGTAENGMGNSGTPYAWFVSFAEMDGKKVAVAVVVEDPGARDTENTGGSIAAPIAKSIMEAVVKPQQ